MLEKQNKSRLKASGFITQGSLLDTNMGKNRDLIDADRLKITSMLGSGKSTLEIAKNMNRDHRTIKKFVFSGKSKRKTPKRSHLRRLSHRDIRKVKIEIAKTPHATSKTIFDNAGVPKTGKTARCQTLKSLAKVMKPIKQPPLTKIHKSKRLEWAQRYMKTDFKNVLFTDECRATLDGPDGWSSGWILHGRQPEVRMRRQQGGGGVMFWAGIKGGSIIGPFKVEQGVKINSESYCELLNKYLMPWLEEQPLSLWRTMIFQHDNAPAHKSKYTSEWLKKAGFNNDKVMMWPPNSPDLNPIENLWAIIKRRVYCNGRQFTNLNELWNAIKKVSASITPTEVSNLTTSVDQRLVKILGNKGCHVHA
jgi:transposase